MEIAMTRQYRLTLSALGTVALALAAHGAWAQQMYRHVGPDGRVSYSDQPPAADSAGQATAGSARTGTAAAAGTASAGLPYELRQTASRYPVGLYTDKDCAPCASARTMLNQRGVPLPNAPSAPTRTHRRWCASAVKARCRSPPSAHSS